MVQHIGNAVGQRNVVAGLEQHSRTGSLDDLGKPAGARHDGRRTGGHAFESDDTERFVERRDDDAAGAFQQGAQLVIGHEPGEVNDVADALHVDLRLQLGQVTTPAGDHTTDVGDAVAEVADRPGEYLESLLVLDPAPRHDQMFALGLGRR